MPATWAPEMGIKFGGGAPQGQENMKGGNTSPSWQPPPGVGGTWDPNRGFKFG